MALVYDINQTITTGAEGIAQLTTVLSQSTWQLHAYGDGSTRITGAWPNAAALNHSGSWVAVKVPGTSRTLVWQRGTDNTAWRMCFTETGLSTDGNGSTIDSALTSSHFKDVFNSGTPGNAGTLFPADNVSGTLRFNVVASDSSPYGWWAGGWNLGTGEARTLLIFDPIIVTTTDPSPDVFTCYYRTSDPWVGKRDTIGSINSTPSKSWYNFGVSPSWVKTFTGIITSNENYYLYPRNVPVNPISGNDDLAPILWFMNNSGTFYFKGVSSLILWIGNARNTGDTFDLSGETDDKVAVGDMALPWPHGIAALV